MKKIMCLMLSVCCFMHLNELASMNAKGMTGAARGATGAGVRGATGAGFRGATGAAARGATGAGFKGATGASKFRKY